MADPAAIEGILFDKDGTLIDYDESWLPVNRELAMIAACGDRLLADRLLLACGMDPATGTIVPDSLLAAGDTRQIANGLIAAGSPLEAASLIDRLDRLFAEAADFSVPVTDLAALFGQLRAMGLRLGIASSDNETSIRRMAERLAITPFIDFIAGYDSGFGTKPDPGMVMGFCAATGLHPLQVAMVGDNNHDLRMGRNAGCGLAVAVLTGTGSRQSLADADYCFDDITGIETLLRQVRNVSAG